MSVWSKEYELKRTISKNEGGGHSGYVYSLAITPDGLLVSGSWDNTIKVWSKEFNLLKTLHN